MSNELTRRPQRMAMKNSLLVVLLVSIAGLAIGASVPPDPTSSGRSGSRANRPVISEPQQGSPAANLTHPVNPSPLKAEHLATIQDVGRTVLAAKHSVQPDPAVEAMHQQLKAVSAELTKVFREGSFSKPVLHRGHRKVASVPSSQANSQAGVSSSLITEILPPSRRLVPGPEPRTFVEETVAPSLAASRIAAAVGPSVSLDDGAAWGRDVASLQSRLANARARMPAGPATSGTRMTDRHLLANKEGQLVDEVQRAVDAQDATQLAALRDRLTPRRLPAERARLQAMADPDHQTKSVAPTPTVSTLTKHR